MPSSKEYDSAPQVSQEVGAEKINNEQANLRTAVDVIGPNGLMQRRKQFARCGACVFFRKPDNCRVVEGPVQPDQVCDWLQVRGSEENDAAKERLSAESQLWANPKKFGWALMKHQDILRFRVLAVNFTGPDVLFLIEDGQDPPHRYSVSLQRMSEMLALDNVWTPEEIDTLVREGMEMDFAPPVNYEEASALFGAGQMSKEDFEPFRREHEASRRA